MAGFPPKPETQVTLANWRTAPFNTWAFQHVRDIVPSADIPHDPGQVRKFPVKPQDLASIKVGRASLAIFSTCVSASISTRIISRHLDRSSSTARQRTGTRSAQHRLWCGSARRRGRHAAGLSYRQQAHADPGRDGQGAERPARDAVAAAARVAARVVAAGASARVAVPGPGRATPTSPSTRCACCRCRTSTSCSRCRPRSPTSPTRTRPSSTIC